MTDLNHADTLNSEHLLCIYIPTMIISLEMGEMTQKNQHRHDGYVEIIDEGLSLTEYVTQKRRVLRNQVKVNIEFLSTIHLITGIFTTC